MFSIQERPKTLFDVLGQEKIVKEFQNRSSKKDFPTYMLFSGKTGSGKSTIAFIIAKLLNCAKPIHITDGDYYEPCNECDSCLDINENRFNRDILYIDASTMGKDDVLELDRIVSRRPFYDDNKIIIIDEAHLLNSAQARGAMLLLSEQPRKNVYFILCTTDTSKFDPAFKSRFASFRFSKVAIPLIGKHLISLLKKHNIKIPEEHIEEFFKEVIGTIAFYADGSVRQAIQYLERCINGGLYTVKEVQEELQAIDEKAIIESFNYLLEGEATKFFNIYAKVEDKEFFYNIVSSKVRGAYIYRHTLTAKNDYEEKLFKGVLGSPYIYKVFTIIEEFEKNRTSNYYFNDKYLTILIISYFNDVSKIKGSIKRERVPVKS